MEDRPHRTLEMTVSVIVGHSRASHSAGESYTTLHTGGKIDTRGRGNVDDKVVNTAAHDVNIAVGLEGVSVGVGTGRGCL